MEEENVQQNCCWRKGKRKVKKYIKLKNLKDFPEFAGIHFGKGMMDRYFCQCGFSCNSYMKNAVCPNCGNTSFTHLPNRTYKFITRTKHNGYDLEYVTLCRSVSIVKNGQEETFLKEEISETNRYALEYLQDIDVLMNEPLIDTIPKYRIARSIIKKSNYKTDFQISSLFRASVKIADAILTYGTEEQKNVEYICGVVYLFRDPKSAQSFANAGTPEQLYEWINLFEELPPHIMQCFSDGTVASKFTTTNIYQINDIPKSVIDVLCNYYMCRYIQTISDILLTLCESGLEEKNADAFVKFFKECYMSGGWYHFVEWLKNGNEFVSVKDYYLRKNRDQFIKAYPANKVDKAFENVYDNPVNTFIQLANI